MTKADLTSTATRAGELESAVTELKNQLEELILAKQSDESVMLEKFRDLLNEKKVKIREQQRILASGSVGPAPAAPAAQVKVEAEDEEISGSSRRAPKASRPSKRKAAQAVEPDDDAESDNAAEKMDVDKNQAEDDSEEEQTTDSDATGSRPDDDDDDDDDNEPPQRGKNQMPSRKKPSPEPARSRRQAPASAKPAGASKKAADPPQAPPPKRSLPFGLGKAKKAAAQDEGSETDDDEL